MPGTKAADVTITDTKAIDMRQGLNTRVKEMITEAIDSHSFDPRSPGILPGLMR